MRFRLTPALFGLLVPLGALCCSDAALRAPEILEATVEEPATLPESCRSWAAESAVHLDGASADLRCEFEEASARLACRTTATDLARSTTSEYASVADFVEAGRLMGKVTSLREVADDGFEERVTHHDYDELGRLLRRREEREQGVVVYSYGDYDDAGRPRRAQLTTAALPAWHCSPLRVAIEYADELRTVTFDYQAASECGEPDRLVQHYDPLGNLIRSERQSSDGTPTTLETALPVRTELACE